MRPATIYSFLTLERSRVRKRSSDEDEDEDEEQDELPISFSGMGGLPGRRKDVGVLAD